MEKNVPASDSPVLFICGHRKCGTTLLLDLLDGNSQLAVYPEDLCVMYGYYPHHIATLATAEARRERFDTVVFKMLEAKANKRGYADRLPVAAFREAFRSRVKGSGFDNLAELLPALLDAFRDAGGTRPDKPLVVKETSLEIYAAEVRSIFPSAKFIHLVRDPRDNFAAINAGVAKYYSKLGENELESLASVVNRVKIGLKFAEVNRRTFGQDNYLVLHFEELVSAPEVTLRKVASFLGIQYVPEMLTPTILGAPQAGNSHDGQALFSISSGNVGRWRERISSSEAQILEFFLSEEMEKFGYERAFTDAQCADAVTDYYKWQNYRYFYRDSFAGLT